MGCENGPCARKPVSNRAAKDPGSQLRGGIVFVREEAGCWTSAGENNTELSPVLTVIHRWRWVGRGAGGPP